MRDADQIDRLFADWNRPDRPGLAVAIVQGDSVVYRRAFGRASLAHGVPNTPETVFRIGSISKHFAVMVALLMEQEGRLSLDDEVQHHYPGLPDYGRPVTLRPSREQYRRRCMTSSNC